MDTAAKLISGGRMRARASSSRGLEAGSLPGSPLFYSSEATP